MVTCTPYVYIGATPHLLKKTFSDDSVSAVTVSIKDFSSYYEKKKVVGMLGRLHRLLLHLKYIKMR
jgi:hypothetical protein